ncbi:hypothetical protein G6Z96_20065, partial [Vibrio aestuarianus subsp. cardii]|nr:hypothetical protein [Vibrio aestuarianus subsp. cardii]
MDEKQIVKFIKGGQFSKLDFLYDEQLQEQNENYYGFLYFLLDKKGIDTSDVLRMIEQEKGSLGYAYEHLGYVASKIYSDFNEYHIPASFFRLATELEPQSSDAWWGLYQSTKDYKALLKSLNLDYANNKYSKIKWKLENKYFIFFEGSVLTKDEWIKLLSIVKDKEIYDPKISGSLLIFGYYYLGLYEDGIILINELEYVHIEILNKYYKDNLISYNYTISKLYDFELDKFLNDDHERLYQESLNRYNNGKLNLTKLGLIQRAFKAKKYDDVIFHYY